MKFPDISQGSETLTNRKKTLGVFSKMKKMETVLLTQAYNTYCFGYQQSSENQTILTFGEFCANIKKANEEGSKLSKGING